MRLLGLDPGLQSTGWGIIDVEGNRLVHVAHGAVVTKARTPLAERLADLDRALSDIVAQHQPARAAVETAFVSRDPAAALKLGQARAIALLVPARAGLSVAEYAPNRIKKSVVGAGHADKAQIRMMVHMLLAGAHVTNEHAADALAVAICDAHAPRDTDLLASGAAR